jgi:glycolate oxidase iron-sulfur subunit
MSKQFSDVELCVKCGLCLPFCPTYGKTQDESESPRGRLSLIQAWAGGQLEATPKLLGHVDNCLLCRACESACPANVPYGRLVDDFRAATAGQQTKPLSARLKSAVVGQALQSPALQRWSGPARGFLSTLGLTQLAGFGELEAGIPAAFEHAPWQGEHPAEGAETAHVALFLGCTAELADAETVTAAIRLLTRLGVRVSVPAAQNCCGAMALHGGDGHQAERMRQGNLNAFDANIVDAIVTLASGCGAVLKEYPDAPGFAKKIKDISRFLGEHQWPENVRLEPLPVNVLLHSPCSLKNVMKSDQPVAALLRRIPGLVPQTLPKTIQCCGAAGTYMLDHPDMARALREDILDLAAAKPPAFLLTSNVGCAMHLRAGLKQRGLGDIQTLHPVTLLERQARRQAADGSV